MSRIQKLQKTRRIRVMVGKYLKLIGGVMVGLPFVLGILCQDLDATMATYKLMIMVITDTKIWIVPVGYLAYQVYKRRR